jgi:hypothetical protein
MASLDRLRNLRERAIITDAEYAAGFLDSVDPESAVNAYEGLAADLKAAIRRFLHDTAIENYRILTIGERPSPERLERNRKVAKLVSDYMAKESV